MLNQADHIARELGHYSTYQTKYGADSLNQFMPIVRKQGNAFLSAPTVHGERFHYFDTGIKRLIIELELDDVCVFLVHLSLKYRHRQYQLRSLHDLIVQAQKPVIVAGDFNTFWGTHEIYLFMRAAGLRSANTAGLPSFPARVPRIELDFILVSEGIEVTDFRVPDVRFSDHRPLVCDFQVPAGRQRAQRLRRLTHGSKSRMNDTARAGHWSAMPTASPGSRFDKPGHLGQRALGARCWWS